MIPRVIIGQPYQPVMRPSPEPMHSIDRWSSVFVRGHTGDPAYLLEWECVIGDVASSYYRVV